jgi:superfamily II DNA or RNA helicase
MPAQNVLKLCDCFMHWGGLVSGRVFYRRSVVLQYVDFLKTKIKTIPDAGFEVKSSVLNELLFEWQKIIIQWAILKGRCALFLDTGLGKTFCQLEWANQIHKKIKENIIIFAPLAVSYQTQREGEKYGIIVHISRGMNDIKPGINIANYEIMDRFELQLFGGIVLDESSCIKHFGTKTASELIKRCQKVKYKLCCTATPTPNDYMELGMHSEFLGIMKRSEMLATFFINDASVLYYTEGIMTSNHGAHGPHRKMGKS